MTGGADFRYLSTADITPATVGGRPALRYPGGGMVVVDAWMAELHAFAAGKTLNQILAERSDPPDKLRAGLACLAEAGFLQRADLPAAPPEQNAANDLPPARISALIIAYEGKTWLAELLPSLLGQTLPPQEIIVIDNASPTPEMSDFLRAEWPQVRLERLEKPLSFAAANNLAVGLAQGELLWFINQDIRLDPNAAEELVRMAASSSNCGAVGAKLRLWWAPQFLNGMGNFVTDHSWGSDIGIGQLDLGQMDHFAGLPSMCLACALIPRKAWERIGPLDEGFPMYYEDSEWSYRARLMGYTILAAPRAVAYHAFGGRIPSGVPDDLPARKLGMVTYGRQRLIRKLAGPEKGQRFLDSYAAEDRRSIARYLLRGQLGHVRAILGAQVRLARDTSAIWREHDRLRDLFPREVAEVFALPERLPAPSMFHSLPLMDSETVDTLYKSLMLTGRTRPMPEFTLNNRRDSLLILSNDIVDQKMAGPGLRYLEMAKALSGELDVTLAAPNPTELEVPGLRLVQYREDVPESVRVLVQNHDQALVSGYMALKFPFLDTGERRVIVDWYDPFFLENYYYYQNEAMQNQSEYNQVAINVVNKLAQMGDFFICGNERQRDLWIGILAANGRINPHNLKADQSLRSLIDVVGVGIPSRQPEHKPFLKGVHPSFPPDCQIVLWGGGIWNWLDPLTLVRAWKPVAEAFPKARLVFLGTRHPNPQVPQHEIVGRLISLAEESGEKDRSIFFFEWLSLEERESLLCESSVGVTLHPIHAETRYSIRTRVLDYIWSGLPVLITDGDVTSEWVEQYQIGEIVPPEDPEAVSAALLRLLARESASWSEAFGKIQEDKRWPKVVQPLLAFCLKGKKSADHLLPGFKASLDEPEDPGVLIRNPIKKAAYLWATRGLSGMVKQALFHLQWRLNRRKNPGGM